MITDPLLGPDEFQPAKDPRRPSALVHCPACKATGPVLEAHHGRRRSSGPQNRSRPAG